MHYYITHSYIINKANYKKTIRKNKKMSAEKAPPIKSNFQYNQHQQSES
jgi:hypothetical protein